MLPIKYWKYGLFGNGFISHNFTAREAEKERACKQPVYIAQFAQNVCQHSRPLSTSTTDALDRGPGRFAGPVIFQAAFAFGVWRFFFRTFSLASQSIEARKKVPVRGSFRHISLRILHARQLMDSVTLFSHTKGKRGLENGRLWKPSRPTIKCIRGTGRKRARVLANILSIRNTLLDPNSSLSSISSVPPTICIVHPRTTALDDRAMDDQSLDVSVMYRSM